MVKRSRFLHILLYINLTTIPQSEHANGILWIEKYFHNISVLLGREKGDLFERINNNDNVYITLASYVNGYYCYVVLFTHYFMYEIRHPKPLLVI